MVVLMNNMFDLSESIRTRASATLQRNVSLPGIHETLIGLFVNGDEIIKELEQKEQECFLIHITKDWNARLPSDVNYQDLFIEDGGINNEW